MLTVEEARDRILAAARPSPGERVALDRCLGRVLIDPVVRVPHDVPPFENSSMDGFAVRAAELPGTLRVAGEVRAGAATLPELGSGEALRIMTGAPMPPGADAVVPVEAAVEEDGAVRIDGAAEAGAYVRAAGHDSRAGDRVELPGPLTPAAIAVLASLGLAEVEVRRRPRVAILSTGDELAAAGAPLRPGQIHDANTPALTAAVREAGAESLPLDRVPDDPARIDAALQRGTADADLLVASGGVSVGRHDHVRNAIERHGRLDFWRIAVQPGKPLAFGEAGGVPVIGLPGNPVSALVTFELFVRPLVRAMLGLAGDGRLHLPATTGERIGKDRQRRAYLRVRLSTDRGRYVARAAGGQASSQLRPLAAGNALLVVPAGVEATEPGATYDAIVIGTPP